MTTIKFTDEHLTVLKTALEVYTRLRSGQVKIAMEEAFKDYMLTSNEAESIENFVRPIIFPEPIYFKPDGHGGYYDQYGNTYDDNYDRISEVTWEEKCRNKRPQFPGKNSYFGVGHEEMEKSGGTLAYEILSTIRQYSALNRNDGYHGQGVDFYDPLNLSGTPLPEIIGFEKEKKFIIRGKAILKKLQKYEDSQDWYSFWDTVSEHLKNKNPELEDWGSARVERSGNYYEIFLTGARKTVKN